MVSRSLSDLHPKLLPLCEQFLADCSHAGHKVGLSCTYRSPEEQNKAYAQGRTTLGKIITNAKAGQSAHNFTLEDGTPAACAFDFFIFAPNGHTLDWDASDPTWKAVIKIGEDIGLESGSGWGIRDNPHMQLRDWKNAPKNITI